MYLKLLLINLQSVLHTSLTKTKFKTVDLYNPQLSAYLDSLRYLTFIILDNESRSYVLIFTWIFEELGAKTA